MSNQVIEVRDAIASDADAIRSTTLNAYAQYAEVMEPDDWTLYERHIKGTLRRIAEATPGTEEADVEQLVACRADVVVGTVLLYPPGRDTYGTEDSQVGEYPEVRLLAVDPAGRGLGIGGRLMDECLSRSRAVGAKRLGLHTMAPMAAARHIYEKMGFVPAPELDFQPFETLAAEAFVLEL